MLPKLWTSFCWLFGYVNFSASWVWECRTTKWARLLLQEFHSSSSQRRPSPTTGWQHQRQLTSHSIIWRLSNWDNCFIVTICLGRYLARELCCLVLPKQQRENHLKTWPLHSPLHPSLVSKWLFYLTVQKCNSQFSNHPITKWSPYLKIDSSPH